MLFLKFVMVIFIFNQINCNIFNSKNLQATGDNTSQT